MCRQPRTGGGVSPRKPKVCVRTSVRSHWEEEVAERERGECVCRHARSENQGKE